MPTSLENIASGIAARKSKVTGAYTGPYDGPLSPSLASLASAPKNLAAMLETVQQSKELLNRLKTSIALCELDIAKKSEEIIRDWNRHTDMPAKDRKKYADQAIAQYRKERVAAMAEAHRADVMTLRDYESKMNAIKSHWQPTSVLAREGIGTPELSMYLERVANSGPAELDNFGREAILTGNRLLGAAVHSRIGTLHKSNRELLSFTSQDLAQALVGRDVDEAHEAIRITVANANDGVETWRKFESVGRPTGTIKGIELALDRKAETGILNDDSGEDE